MCKVSHNRPFRNRPDPLLGLYTLLVRGRARLRPLAPHEPAHARACAQAGACSTPAQPVRAARMAQHRGVAAEVLRGSAAAQEHPAQRRRAARPGGARVRDEEGALRREAHGAQRGDHATLAADTRAVLPKPCGVGTASAGRQVGVSHLEPCLPPLAPATGNDPDPILAVQSSAHTCVSIHFRAINIA